MKNKMKNFHIFFFHKSLRKNVPICHIAATPLNSGKNNGRKRLSAGDSASVMQPRKKELKITDLFKKT